MRNAYAGDGGTVGRVPARVDVCRYRGAGDCDPSGIIQLRPGMNSWPCTHSGFSGPHGCCKEAHDSDVD